MNRFVNAVEWIVVLPRPLNSLGNRLVSRSLLGLDPAEVPRGAGPGLVELLKSMGVEAERFDVDDDV